MAAEADAQRSARAAAGRDRARRPHAGHRRARALPPAQGSSRDARDRRRAAHRLDDVGARRRAARAPTRSCASRSARSSCSAVVERLAGGSRGSRLAGRPVAASEEEQLLLYARDLRHLLELERGQRALAPERLPRDGRRRSPSALESKDTGTRRAFAARAALRAASWPCGRARAARRPEHASTASCSTTSARSGSPTRSCRSRRR